MRAYYVLVNVKRNNQGKVEYYELKNNSTGELSRHKSKEIKSAIASKSIEVQGLTVKSGKLYVDKSLSKRVNTHVDNKKMQLITGKALFNNMAEYKGYRHRWYVKDVVNKLENSNSKDIYAIYGIRRTGKTVSIWHIIQELIDKGISESDILHINILQECDMEDLIEVLDKSEQKYIFIDEITRIFKFIDKSNIISDIYAQYKKIVVTGTDSLAIRIASYDRLYGRVKYVRSNLISFNEYIDIFNTKKGNESVLKFIANGGTTYTLDYKNEKTTYDTINTSVAGNIINTLQKNKATEHYRKLEKLEKNQIAYIVYCIISSMMCVKDKKEITTDFKKITSEVIKMIDSLCGGMIIGQHIVNTQGINKNHWANVYSALVQLDIIDTVNNLAINSEMVHIESDVEIVCNLTSMYYAISKAVKKKLTDTDIGGLLENVVMQQCMLWVSKENNSTDLIDKYGIGYARYKDITDNVVREIDVVIPHTVGEYDEAREVYNLIEVKHSNKIKSLHHKNFKANSIYKMFGEDTNNIIVYFGDTTLINIDVNGKSKLIRYVNIYDFLTDIGKWLI